MRALQTGWGTPDPTMPLLRAVRSVGAAELPVGLSLCRGGPPLASAAEMGSGGSCLRRPDRGEADARVRGVKHLDRAALCQRRAHVHVKGAVVRERPRVDAIMLFGERGHKHEACPGAWRAHVDGFEALEALVVAARHA